jgi:UDP-N-acetylmuramate dehydrogenase
MSDSSDTKLESTLTALSDGVKVARGVLGSTVTTLAVGGPLAHLITVDDLGALPEVVRILHSEGELPYILGNGSNLLIGDAGVAGWVIRLGGGARRVQPYPHDEFEIEGAASLMQVARQLSQEGFSGLEFAAGIPASLGGAVFMNAGAHGSELCERIVRVSAILSDGSLRIFEQGELPWRYRSSGLPAGAIVTSVRLRLPRGDKDRIADACAHNLAARRATQPLALPSAGSIFRNPAPDCPAGRVIEQVGLKGRTEGGAMISELHANWIVNPQKKAQARDVVSLIKLCQHTVREQRGIELEAEVKMWGFPPQS